MGVVMIMVVISLGMVLYNTPLFIDHGQHNQIERYAEDLSGERFSC